MKPQALPDWILTTQQLPPRATPAADVSDLVTVVVVTGFTDRRLAQAWYSYRHACWQNTLEVFGLSAWNWVTHWQPLPVLPEPVAKESILAYIQALEPDYVEATPRMRVLFADVDPADRELQDKLFHLVARTGLQGTRVLGRGPMKGNHYYIDFWADEALHVRQLKQALSQAPVAYVIRPRTEVV